MRNLLLIFLLSISVVSCKKSESCRFDFSMVNEGDKYIILMHPTVNNIKTFEYLVNNNIFALPEGYKVLGVYHTGEKFDYSKTEQLIADRKLSDIQLLSIDNELNPESIYKQNGSSETFKKLFELSRGAIFFGGPDIPPACYNEPTNLQTIITDPYRHYMELSFLYHLLGGNQDSSFTPLMEQNPDFALLGICLGMQSMNVATGGTMVQDIPTEVYSLNTIEDVLGQHQNLRHRNYNSDFGIDDEVTTDNYHQIQILNGESLKEYVPSDTIHPYVLSSHHQCLEKLGRGFRVAATSMDGKIVESIVHNKYRNVLGVQFHPEVTELYLANDKIKEFPFIEGKYSFIDLYGGDKGENFQREIWKKFSEKFQ